MRPPLWAFPPHPLASLGLCPYLETGGGRAVIPCQVEDLVVPLTHPPLMRLLRTRALLDSRFLGVLSALLPGGSLLGWAHFIEPNMVEITHHRAPLGGAKPLRILHLSDLHFTRDIPWAHRVLKKVAEVPCDVMVITGDVIHVGVKPKEVEALLAQLPEPPLGRYACIGNWDRWGGWRMRPSPR